MESYLTFTIEHHHFALPIKLALEVIEPKEITPVPNMPPFLMGMISLRGEPIPVMDLANRLQLSETQGGERNIVIVELGEGLRAGMLVHQVLEVVKLDPAGIRPPPESGFVDQLSKSFVSGLTRLDEDRFLVLLDLAKIFQLETLARSGLLGTAAADLELAWEPIQEEGGP